MRRGGNTARQLSLEELADLEVSAPSTEEQVARRERENEYERTVREALYELLPTTRALVVTLLFGIGDGTPKSAADIAGRLRFRKRDTTPDYVREELRKALGQLRRDQHFCAILAHRGR